MRTRLAVLAVFLLAVARASAADDNSATVELLSGQILHGSITDPTLTIHTRWGDLDAQSQAIVNIVCQPPPHVLQTIETQNGDELVGRVAAASIHLVSDGKTIELPLSQISRIGEERRPQPPPAASTPQAVLRGLSGDHLTVIAPPSVSFRTRWGLLEFKADQIRDIVFSDKDQAAHRISLSDGSVLSGMMATDTLTMTPKFIGGTPLTAPIGEMASLMFGNFSPKSNGPRVDLVGGDVLRGSIQGTITIQTAYGDVPVVASDVQRLTAAADISGDWTVTVAGSRTISGSPRETTVTCLLDCGVSVTVPTAMVMAYSK